MLKWFRNCFGFNENTRKSNSKREKEYKRKINILRKREKEKEREKEYKKNLRHKLCEACNDGIPIYYHIPSYEATHCKNCREEGMKIFIQNKYIKNKYMKNKFRNTI
jgi:hypothetical protein